MTTTLTVDTAAKEVVDQFTIRLGGIEPSFHIKERPDGYFLVFEFANPHSRFYRIIEEIDSTLGPNHSFYNRCVISPRPKKPTDVLSTPETLLLQRAIAESLTVDRHSFGDDFFSRYTPSVTNFERQITSSGNYIVFGRRGAGKSSLLAYAMHTFKTLGQPFAWIAMQTYSNRNDDQATCSVLAEILEEVKTISGSKTEVAALIEQLDQLSESGTKITEKLDKLLPKVRKQIQTVSTQSKPFTIFLDDFHVLKESFQPTLLNALYSVTRGNNAFIKLSGIEQFTRTWDETSRRGLQPPHDAQLLKLDLNLTMPDRSKAHIVSILNAHAIYCGLPSIMYLTSDDLLSRLVLVAAGVPRDALGLFAQAINKTVIKGQKTVSLMSLNAAASEMAEGKLKDIEKDTAENLNEVNSLLEKVKTFCITQQRKNSFLVRIRNSDTTYQIMQRLIALRFVHILHEGITPNVAGHRYMALMLDYGFYVGIRAARSVELFPTEPRALSAKDLRRLPIFS